MLTQAGFGDLTLDDLKAAAADIAQREELIVKIGTDQELQQALQSATTPEAKRDVLAQAGYGDITLDDIRAAAADLANREELSDEELEMVSGGSDKGMEAYGAFGSCVIAGGTAGAAFGGVGGGVGLLVGVAVGIAAAVEISPPSDW